MTRATLGAGGLLGSDPDDEGASTQAVDSLARQGRHATTRAEQRSTGQPGVTGTSEARVVRPGIPNRDRGTQV